MDSFRLPQGTCAGVVATSREWAKCALNDFEAAGDIQKRAGYHHRSSPRGPSASACARDEMKLRPWSSGDWCPRKARARDPQCRHAFGDPSRRAGAASLFGKGQRSCREGEAALAIRPPRPAQPTASATSSWSQVSITTRRTPSSWSRRTASRLASRRQRRPVSREACRRVQSHHHLTLDRDRPRPSQRPDVEVLVKPGQDGKRRRGQRAATVITLGIAGQQSRCRMTVSRRRAASDEARELVTA